MKQIKRWNYKCASFDYAQEPRINYADWLAHDVFFGHKSFINQSLIFASVLEDDGGKPPGLIAL